MGKEKEREKAEINFILTPCSDTRIQIQPAESAKIELNMRLVVQRVSEAEVKVEGGEIVGKIAKGLFVLVGVKEGDKLEDAEILAAKLFKLRVMADPEGKMNLSVGDAGGEFLVVSQFTLHADTSGGNRPSFINAGDPKVAKEIYEHFVAKLKSQGAKVEIGSFGNHMEIDAKLDGPVTIIVDSSL